MKDWEKLEQNIMAYLNEKFSLDGFFYFRQIGSHHSNKSDIIVERGDDILFSIDVKMAKAQASPFTVAILNNSFEFSPKPHAPIATDTQAKIIEYLNEGFDKYEKVSTAGLEIDCDQKLIYEHIKTDYAEKGVEYFISSKNIGRDFKIIPLEFFDKSFDIRTVIRRKRSGPSSLSKLDFSHFRNDIESFLKDLGIKSFSFEEQHMRYFSPANLDSMNLSSSYPLNEKVLLSLSKNYVLVKRRSQTKNPTVITEITFNGYFDEQWKIDFVNNLSEKRENLVQMKKLVG